jgi:nucleoside-diphosphate-sugar epimerase
MYMLSAIIEFICIPIRVEPPIFRRRVKFYKNNRAFNIEKAIKMLGYQPKVSLQEGMKRTVQWYRQNGYLD